VIHQDEIRFETGGHGEMRDLTAEVAVIVRASGVRIGTVHVYNVGSTGAISTVEFEPGLERDVPEQLDRLLPPSTDYGHEQTWHDGNGHSHLQATLMGPELTVPIKDGELLTGTWQQIFHLECDNKPHHRRIVVTVSGD